MPFKEINIKITNNKEEYSGFGYLDHFRIDFSFPKKPAVVEVAVLSKKKLYVKSETDGYHWLHFWLSQNPDGEELVETNYQEETIILKSLFASYGWEYNKEDKETAFISLKEDFKKEDIFKLAKIISPRFAIREKYYND